MKKSMFMLTIAFCAFGYVNAQEGGSALVSKKNIPILPAAGDYALGFNAVPLVDFALNAVTIMTNTGDKAMHPGYVSGNTSVLVGKYFVDDQTAYRGRLAINRAAAATTTYFDDPKDKSAEPGEISDKMTVTTSAVVLGAGIEKRRGYGRLQGFYGGEALLGLSGGSTKYKYGVAMDKEAIDSSYTNGDGSAVSAGRTLSMKAGTGITFGVRGFTGVEYFVLPKVSIGAEFGWSIGIITTARGSSETETWSVASATAETKEAIGSSKTSTTAFAVDNGLSSLLGASAALNLLFHF